MYNIFKLANVLLIVNVHICITTNVRFNYSTNCLSGDRIYIWKGNSTNYMSIKNASLNESLDFHHGILQDVQVRVIVFEMYPYVIYNTKTGHIEGFIGNFWESLENMLQFENDFILENDYDIALNRIVNGEADILLGGVVSNEKLNKAAVYSQPYILNWYKIAYREPEISGPSDFYVHAFRPNLLMATVILYFMLSIALWGGHYFLSRCRQGITLSLPICILVVVGGFLNQTFDLKIRSLSMRLLIIVALFFGYILVSSLNAVLVSQITNLHIVPPIKSLDDIALKRTHTLCVRNNSFVYNYFLDNNRVILPKWKGIVNGPICGDIQQLETIAAIICRTDVIILENRPIFAAVFNLFPVPCNLGFLPGKEFLRYNFIAYRKDFRYRRIFAKALNQIKSSGIMKQLENKWFSIKTSFSLNHKHGSVPSVHFYHVAGLLGLLFIMILISLFVLGVEILYNKINRLPYTN